MFKQILVPAQGDPTDAAVFALAQAVSREFGAHLLALHVRADPMAATIGLGNGGMADGFAVGDMMAAIETQAATGEAQSRAGFESFRAAAHLTTVDPDGVAADSASFVVEVGDANAWLTDYARTSDLLVIGRARGEDPVAMDLLQDVLTRSGRPMLLAAATPPAYPCHSVVIAWKDSPEAARAVAAALPFIARASEVLILAIAEADQADAVTEAATARLLQTLRRHNPRVERRHVAATTASPVETLLAAAKAAEASLLVMGGYGHGMLREMVFGGFTQSVLRAAGMPVLLMH